MSKFIGLAVAASLMLGAPAFAAPVATTYSGTGSWFTTPEALSGWKPQDQISWSFTLLPIEDEPGFAEVQDFNLSIGTESWTMADFVPVFLPVPMGFFRPWGPEVFFTGVTPNNTMLVTGARVFDNSFPRTGFLVGNLAVEIQSGYTVGVLDASAAAIPEPASWAMLIAGFGLVGAVARRRRMMAA